MVLKLPTKERLCQLCDQYGISLSTDGRSAKPHICLSPTHTSKPTLPNNAPIAVVLFAGGGGVEVGMLSAGICPVIAVEFDPSKLNLSRAIAKTHERNFNSYGCRVIELTVQEIAPDGGLWNGRKVAD